MNHGRLPERGSLGGQLGKIEQPLGADGNRSGGLSLRTPGSGGPGSVAVRAPQHHAFKSSVPKLWIISMLSLS